MEHARFGDLVLTEPTAVTHDPADLDRGGVWGVVVTFEGELTAVRFDRVAKGAPPPTGAWFPPTGTWSSSMTKGEYVAGVERIREHIAAGDVYQVNLCRVMSAPLPPEAHLPSLAPLLEAGNPAPYAGVVHIPSAGLDVVTASPEAYLLRDGDRIISRPIKGTGRVPVDLGAKDHAENVMITDLVRNDLSHVAVPGTVDVEALCALEEHPGLLHLTSDVAARLRPGTTWTEILEASFPPGSVSGAPKSSALRIIGELEPTPRGPYCGAIGWVDADTGTARLAVGIRTFWAEGQGEGRTLRFGTGAGITWGSDPSCEWDETELKAGRLVAIASRSVEGQGQS
nr:chorismate-binding protein [Janibacter endophyticus]